MSNHATDMSSLAKEVEVDGLFPTPVATLTLQNSTSLNNSLRETILSRRKTVSGVKVSNQGGWQSDHAFFDWCGEAGNVVLAVARKLADELTQFRDGNKAEIEWVVSAWANVNEFRDSNELHIHPGSYWSGVYYVDDGGEGKDDSCGGELELHDPRGAGAIMYSPNLTFSIPGTETLGAVQRLRPAAGMMVQFPSWLPHAVRPYLGHSTRISIAWNLSPVPSSEAKEKKPSTGL